MGKRLEKFSRLALLALAVAVPLRPVIVEASPNFSVFQAPPQLVSSFSHSGQSKLSCSSSRIKKQSAHQTSNLKLLPKNTVGFYSLAPQFEKMSLSLELSRSFFGGASLDSHSPQKFLILRI